MYRPIAGPDTYEISNDNGARLIHFARYIIRTDIK